MGGPGVFPPQPEGITNMGQIKRAWVTSPGADRYRRGLYTFVWRGTPHPLLTVFDAPDPARACTRRMRSNTPLQALLMLNDEAFLECARTLARRVCVEAESDADRVDRLFLHALGRRPADAERDRLFALLNSERAATEGDAAWTSLARVVLNLDEFLTRE
jgi:hypothetical protein